MTSYEFEKVAKNAVVLVLKREHGIETSLPNLQIVWFTHCLGYKKCCLYSPEIGNKYAEVTYNRDKEELYVDIYEKTMNVKFHKEDFNFEA